MKKMVLAVVAAALVILGLAQLNKSPAPVAELPAIPVENGQVEAVETSDLIDMNDDDRRAFRSEVRAYLLENPEVLMEAIQVLEQRQQQDKAANDDALVASNLAEINEDGYSYVGGNPEGDVTLVEFLDYRCGFCRRAHGELTQLLKDDPNIRFVVKEFPILGEQSTISARLAIATLHKAGPEAYHELGNFLIEFNGNLTEKSIEAILTRQGLNAAEILAYMEDDAVTGQIASVSELAGKLQIGGTPTFVLGGEMVRGYIPLANMKEMVAYYRATQE
jgi:protein-disulfide isomerase